MTNKIDEIKTDATLPDLSKADVVQAKKEGELEAVKEGAKAQFKATDGVAVLDDPEPGITPTYNVFHLQDMVDLDPDVLAKALDGKQDGYPALSEGQIAGLLEVERSGKNRTDVVEVLCKRLGIKSPYEVTDAGPAYTNDVSRSVIKRG